jgi:hypothetical protein
MNTYKKILISVLFVGLIAGCGRYLPPIAPEMTAPRQVTFQGVEPLATSVTLKWGAPEESRQGKKLKSLEGYKVYRRDVPMTRLERERDTGEYTLLGIVADESVDKRRTKEFANRAELKSGRQVKLSPEELRVQFVDSAVKPGHLYLYKIVAYNSLSAEGFVKSYIELLFNGEKSVMREIFNEDEAGMLLSKVTALEEEEEQELQPTEEESKGILR